MKHLLTLGILCFVFVDFANAETFKNTNDDENGKSFGQLMSWVFDGEKSPERVEIETSDEWRELSPDQLNYAVWIGHATYLINNGDINILTDPIFAKRASPIGFAGPKRMIPAVMTLKDLPTIDVVVVSHNHYDHLDMYSLKKLHKLNPETIFMVPMGDGKRLKRAGLTHVHELRWWESMEVGRTTIHFTPFNIGLKEVCLIATRVYGVVGSLKQVISSFIMPETRVTRMILKPHIRGLELQITLLFPLEPMTQDGS